MCLYSAHIMNEKGSELEFLFEFDSFLIQQPRAFPAEAFTGEMYNHNLPFASSSLSSLSLMMSRKKSAGLSCCSHTNPTGGGNA